MTEQNQALESYEAQAKALAAKLAPALAAPRQAAFERFSRGGIPATRLESWKYTNLARALRTTEFRTLEEAGVLAGPDLLPAPLAEGAQRIVFVNGRFRRDLSAADLPDGVRIDSLRDLAASQPSEIEKIFGEGLEEPLFDLNTVLAEDGAVLSFEPGTIHDRPIEILWLSGLTQTPASFHPRLAIRLGAGAAGTVVERCHGLGDQSYFANAAGTISLAPAARLNHLRLNADSAGAIQTNTILVRLSREATYNGFLLNLGAALSRQEIHAWLEGEQAECRLNGAYLLSGAQHGDVTTRIEHRAPSTISRETFKGALDDRARAVFQGKIVVDPDAQKADGRMLNKTLLLSDKAEIDSKPELEIYADDVQCAHGATAGEIDNEALFYLRSRGIAEPKARAILVESFLADALDGFAVEALRPALDACLAEWLAARGTDEGTTK